MEPGMLLSLLLLCAAGGTAATETTEEVPSTHTPHVLSASKTVVVRKGEEAVFDCEVDELGGFAKVWKKDDMLYFTNDFDFVQDPRVRLNEDGSLRVLQIQPGDAGEYVCQISTERPLELRHRLVVIVPPSVEPVPGSGRMTVGLGQNFTVGCRAEGSPGPIVTWTRPNENGEKQEAGDGAVLQVWSAEEKDSGEYRCTVSNGYDPAVEASILVDVVHRPVVGAAEKVVYTGRGATARLSCFAYGKPLPLVVWLGPDGTPVRPSDRRVPESSGGDHRLRIRRIRDEDLGEYVCRADNPLGTARVNIQLSAAEEVDDDRLTKMEEKETDAMFPVKYEVTMAPESSTEEDGAAGLREFFPSALLICCLLPLLR